MFLVWKLNTEEESPDWIPVWGNEDAEKSANHLRLCVQNDLRRRVFYRLTFEQDMDKLTVKP